MQLALVGLIAACAGEVPGEDLDLDAAIPEPDAASGAPTAADLLARIAICDPVGGPYSSGGSGPANVAICGFPGAVAWTSELDIDCDGKRTPECNLATDPAYMDQTAASDSRGDPLDAAALPYVVIPGRSARFDYRAAGLAMGSIVAVVYDGRVAYGPLGDVGPQASIGEASYAMAVALGIDPDPRTGGTSDAVRYIAFTGDSSKLVVIEDRNEANSLGIDRATLLLSQR